MKPVIVLGAGTFATEVLEAAQLAGHAVAGFVVSDPGWRESDRHEELPVATVADMPWQPANVLAIGGIVTTRRRDFIEAIARRGFEFATIVHPSATVSPRARFEPGGFAGAQVIVAANTRIGAHALLNRGANVGHDVSVGAYSTIGPGVTIAGGVVIGAGAYLGVGAVVRDHVTIGEGAIVAAGAVVVKPVAARTQVAGCPARVVAENVQSL